MKSTISTILALIFGAWSNTARNSSNWAVLIAGSNGYYNYRHQSDIAHSYQILTKMGGFPADKVIVMMYNDVVNSSSNPFPGQLFNEPGGQDIYGDIIVSYSGEQVTAKNFLNVIQGIKEGDTKDGPVLESNADDHVFIYYSDHGATGLVAMPTGDPLYATDLNKALDYMYANKMYKQLVFYLEACESGSMFDGILTRNTSVFATTAATPDQPSYAFYYNQTLNTYMADEYSIRWMQDSTNNWNGQQESLIQQYTDVKNIVNESQPQKYGDEKFDKEPIEEFQAYEDGRVIRKNILKLLKNSFKLKNNNKFEYNKEWIPSSAVSSRDVKLATLQNQYLAAKYTGEKIHFAALVGEEIEYRLSIDLLFDELVDYIIAYILNDELKDNDYDIDIDYDLADAIKYGHTRPTDYECLKSAYSAYEISCERFTDYSLKYVSTLVNLCELFHDKNLINDSLKNVC
eukprot:841946_1